MNDKHPDIPMILSHAPKPAAPSDLKNTLLADASMPLRRNANKRRSNYTNQSWLRRWWPALAPATVSLACAVVLTFQQSQVSELKERLEILKPSATPAMAASESSSSSQSPVVPAHLNSDAEIEQLKARTAQLAADIAQLEQLLRENENLRNQIAAASANRLTPDELRAIDDAKRRAERIMCVNNLKQIGLAIRMWSLDHKDAFPTNIADTITYTPTVVFICPGDTNRPAAKDAASFTDANCSYEFFVGDFFKDPQQVVTLCRIHNNAGLADGSVQQFTPDQLVEKDGKLYIGARQ